MPDDYVAQTIAAYDAGPDKYVAATDDMLMERELDTFSGMLPDISSPVLDAGCAYGKDSTVLSLKGLQVVGIDMSAELLKRAKQASPDVEYLQMDVRRLEFPDATFSGVWCNAVLPYLSDQDVLRALQEIRRVLKPNGVICVSFKEGQGNQAITEALTGDQPRFYNFKTVPEAQAALVRAGFSLRQSYIVNERERFGPDKHDLNWIYCFAVKQ